VETAGMERLEKTGFYLSSGMSTQFPNTPENDAERELHRSRWKYILEFEANFEYGALGDFDYWENISSQHFLYRMNATFGMPPPEENYNETCRWSGYLQHEHGISTLFLEDFWGSTEIESLGYPKANEDAQKLCNYLVGPNYKHTEGFRSWHSCEYCEEKPMPENGA
jgi:hypothetical protein